MDISTSLNAGLNTGLTQALSDGTHDYLYGHGRIAQLDTGALNTEYFLGDALGSVRQLTDSSGAVTLARTYDPYGKVNTTSGAGSSGYGFTNEYQSQGLIYLRSRMYSPVNGRFLTRDTWSGDANRPLSFNRWGYVEGNPVNFVDPTGHSATSDDYPPMFFDGMEVCFQLAHDATWLAVDQGLRTIPDFRGMCIVEKVMVPDPSDYINTYVAAGVAIESNYYTPWTDTRGSLFFKISSWLNRGGVGLGICNISDEQMNAIYGKPIGGNRKNGFGLGLPGLNQENPVIAIQAMRNRITQVIDACVNCSSTDKFIAAALAEGSNLNKDGVAILREIYQRKPNDSIQGILSWNKYLLDDLKSYNHNLRQIRLFQLDIIELRKRSLDWVIPFDLNWQYIMNLGNGFE